MALSAIVNPYISNMTISAEKFYADLEPTCLNEIQKAQNRYSQDPRKTSGDPSDRKYGLAQGMLFNNCSSEDIDLRTGEPLNQQAGVLFEMSSTREALKRAHESQLQNPNLSGYMSPISPELLQVEKLTQEVVFGEGSEIVDSGRIASVPLPGMAQSFKLGLNLLKEINPQLDTVVLGSNSYGGYESVLKEIFPNIVKYRHAENNAYNFENFQRCLNSLPNAKKALVLIQADAYNYTGVNHCADSKKAIVELLQKTGAFPLIDNAYQGLVEGMEEDVEIARLLAATDLPFIVSDSWSKKAALYGQRISLMHFVTGNESQKKRLRDIIYARVRRDYVSINPSWRIVRELLADEKLKEHWLTRDVPKARDIMRTTKEAIAEIIGLEELAYISPQHTQGMFNGLPISHEGADYLAEEKGVHVVKTYDQDTICSQGQNAQAVRVNMGGVPKDGVAYVAESFLDAYKKYGTKAFSKKRD